jgi:hypothetical protein
LALGAKAVANIGEASTHGGGPLLEPLRQRRITTSERRAKINGTTDE